MGDERMKPMIRIEGTVGRLVLVEQFDFNVHREFRQATQSLLEDTDIQEIWVDFDQVTFLDSSALGMLLLLKERAEGVKKGLVLANCKDVVLQVLQIACFDRLFTLR